MPFIGRGFYIWESISFKKHVQCVACCCIWVVLKQIKKVVVTEVLVEVVLGGTAVVYRGEGHRFFINLATVNFLLNSPYSQKSVYNNVSFLADSKNTIDGLVIVGWIPVGI